MDTITLRGVEVFAHHGVLDSERADGQPFIIDVDVSLDLSEACRTDDLARTIDYGRLADAIHQRVSGEQWNLIERVAERVADLVLAIPLAAEVVVTVHKPQAPIDVAFGDVSVTITRGGATEEA